LSLLGKRSEAAAGAADSRCPVRRFPLNQPAGHKTPVPDRVFGKQRGRRAELIRIPSPGK